MGSTDNYSVTLTIQRLNKDDKGVQRLVKPALRVMTEDKSGNFFYQLVYLDAKDTVTATFAVDGSKMKNFSCTVLDIDGVSNWVDGASPRSAAFVVDAGTPQTPGFVYHGSLAFVNDCLAANNSGIISTAVLRDNLGLDMKGLRIGAARTALQNAYNAKGGALTIGEMQKALEDAST